MIEQSIENCIIEILSKDIQNFALDFIAYFRTNEMIFKRGKGYWEDKFYFMVKYQNEFICFILIGDSENRGIPWIIWSDSSDSSDSQWYENTSLDERIKEIAFQNIDFCGKCSPNSSCYGGTHKMIFGKEFDNVCVTTFRFDNPNVESLECVKKMVELRKDYILRNKKL